MTPRMLAALTGLPESFARVTGMPASFAACANSFAGRACSPWDEPIRTVREMAGMWTSLSLLCRCRWRSAWWCEVCGRRWPPGSSDRVTDQREGARAVHIREDVGREKHDGRPAHGRIPLD